MYIILYFIIPYVSTHKKDSHEAHSGRFCSKIRKIRPKTSRVPPLFLSFDNIIILVFLLSPLLWTTSSRYLRLQCINRSMHALHNNPRAQNWFIILCDRKEYRVTTSRRGLSGQTDFSRIRFASYSRALQKFRSRRLRKSTATIAGRFLLETRSKR